MLSRLAARPVTSHSNGPGSVSSKSFRLNQRCSRDWLEAEFARSGGTSRSAREPVGNLLAGRLVEVRRARTAGGVEPRDDCDHGSFGPDRPERLAYCSAVASAGFGSIVSMSRPAIIATIAATKTDVLSEGGTPAIRTVRVAMLR